MRYGFEDMTDYDLIIEKGGPLNYEQVMNDGNCIDWRIAMEEEMHSLYKNCTWNLIQLPKNKRLLGANRSPIKRRVL